MTRTAAEILARYEAIQDHDFLGTESSDLVLCLSYDEARPVLSRDVTRKTWTAGVLPRDPADVETRLREYMPFAWDKANGCRGLSAGRSMSHMSAWLWLMGHDEAADAVKEYSHYGKPQLRAICEHFGIDWEALDDGRWSNDEYGEGEPPFSADLAFNTGVDE